jgi:PilZ domain
MVESERRKEPRHRTLKAGLIAFNRAGTIECRVRNLSPVGACLEVTSQVGIPEEFLLLVEHDHMKKNCRVIWRKPNKLGVEFLSDRLLADLDAGQRNVA